MVRAGWVFVRNEHDAGANTNEPKWPAEVTILKSVIPLEVYTLEGKPAFPHSHTLVGGFGIASKDAPVEFQHHWHAVITDPWGGYYEQITLGADVHIHDDKGYPLWFMAFIAVDEMDIQVLVDSSDVHIIVEVNITQDPMGGDYIMGDMDETPWSPAERTLWVDRVGNVMGLSLPAVVDRGSRLVRWFIGLLMARRTFYERGLRFGSV